MMNKISRLFLALALVITACSGEDSNVKTKNTGGTGGTDGTGGTSGSGGTEPLDGCGGTEPLDGCSTPTPGAPCDGGWICMESEWVCPTPFDPPEPPFPPEPECTTAAPETPCEQGDPFAWVCIGGTWECLPPAF